MNKTSEPEAILSLINKAKTLFETAYGTPKSKVHCTVAPGRVNLIGEHTDYTGGYVLPFAIGYSTVAYGSGSLKSRTGGGKCRVVSANDGTNTPVEFIASKDMKPPEGGDGKDKWARYVSGVVSQYLPDLPERFSVSFDLAVAGDVPLGSGLSSSASLEVAVARFVETVIDDFSSDAGCLAFGSSEDVKQGKRSKDVVRALRCQKAENTWCNSPCGIMDQYVSSNAKAGCLLLIDCKNNSYEEVQMGEEGQEKASIVIADSNVKHSIAAGEYPIRVEQCKVATEALQKVDVQSLRDATLGDVEKAKKFIDDVIYRRAKHVVAENARTLAAKSLLEKGDWTKVGELMNESHESMKDDYEVSCNEINVLVSLARAHKGVYGSRMTGGGFGGCTVTLVEKQQAKSLMKHLKDGYKKLSGKDCECFVTSPGNGVREIEC